MKKFLCASLLLGTLLAAGCYSDEVSTIAADIPNAENLLLSANGDLYMSATGGVYLYDEDRGGICIYSEPGNDFLGMAEYNNYLYVIRMHTGLQIGNALDLGSFLKAGSIRELVVLLGGIISDKYLLRASLDGFYHDADGNLKLDFKPVCSLNNMFMPNGMDVDSKGYLYIADETFLQTGAIVRVTLHDNSFSLRTALSASSGAYSPNGVDINNDTIYYTDIKMSSLKTYVKKARIVNGVISNPVTICEKPVVTLSGLNLFDDLDYGTYKGTTGVLVANYAGNSLLAVSANGSYVKEMFKNQIAMPSSCLIGPDATSLDGGIVITEKGMLMEGSSDFGNKVSIAYY